LGEGGGGGGTGSITKFQYCKVGLYIATLESYDTNYTYLWKAAETYYTEVEVLATCLYTRCS